MHSFACVTFTVRRLVFILFMAHKQLISLPVSLDLEKDDVTYIERETYLIRFL